MRAQTSEPSTVPACQKAVHAFITMPSKITIAALSEPDDATCWAVIASSNKNLKQLDRWTAQGNRWTAHYLARHLKQLDGGNLEDALVALGQFSERDMEQILRFAKSGLLSKRELSDALTMLPLSLTDNPHGQLNALVIRRSNVMRVTREDLSQQRAQALSAIDDFASEIKSHNPTND